jgi:hypothetical protein
MTRSLTKSKTQNGYEKIRDHFVFDVKHYGCYKVRLVANRRLTVVLCVASQNDFKL